MFAPSRKRQNLINTRASFLRPKDSSISKGNYHARQRSLIQQFLHSSPPYFSTGAELCVDPKKTVSAKFELGQARNAAQMIRKVLEVYHISTVITETEKTHHQKDIAWKLNFLRFNVWYVWLRMKRGDLAIEAFEAAMADQKLCIDNDILLIAIQDHLILAFLCKNKNKEVYKVYSQTIKTRIEMYGPRYAEYQKILTKFNFCEGEIDYHLHPTTENVNGSNFSADDNDDDELCNRQGETKLERPERLLEVVPLMRRSSFL